MKVLTMEQGSLEWLAARAGMVTASRIKDVMASKSTAGYADYRAQIVAEILTGVPNESGFVSDAMKWGTDKEPLARAEYNRNATSIRCFGRWPVRVGNGVISLATILVCPKTFNCLCTGLTAIKNVLTRLKRQ